LSRDDFIEEAKNEYISQQDIVYKERDGSWANKLQGEKRPSTFHRMQEEAIASARDMLENEGGGRLTIKGEDGLIRDKNTIPPRKDSHPPQR
jgi:hypothetical protein